MADVSQVEQKDENDNVADVQEAVQEPLEVAEESAEPAGTADAAEAAEAVGGDSDAEKLAARNKEAAKYRRRLRDEEAAHEETRRLLDGLRRQQFEETARGINSRVKPEFWHAFLDYGDFITDDGRIDGAALKESMAEVMQEYGVTTGSLPRHVMGGRAEPIDDVPSSWSEALRGK